VDGDSAGGGNTWDRRLRRGLEKLRDGGDNVWGIHRGRMSFWRGYYKFGDVLLGVWVPVGFLFAVAGCLIDGRRCITAVDKRHVVSSYFGQVTMRDGSSLILKLSCLGKSSLLMHSARITV
jgi:hypothetical protein